MVSEVGSIGLNSERIIEPRSQGRRHIMDMEQMMERLLARMDNI
jgi:hypothetical protein